MSLSERKKQILAAVVEEYISKAEPVGSKAIATSLNLGLSSATIRNELAELTNLGYLEQPHTSAGRIPSSSGYRIYVNEIMERQRLSLEETEKINQSLHQKMAQLDKLMNDVGKIASSLTSYPALALSAPSIAVCSRFDLIPIDANTFIVVLMLDNSKVFNKLIRLPVSVDENLLKKTSLVLNNLFTNIVKEQITADLIADAELATGDNIGLISVITAFTLETLKSATEASAYVSGTSRLLNQPEFKDVNKAHELMTYLSDNGHILELPQGISSEGKDIEILIGPENVAEELKDSSVVIARYDAGDNMKGIIGVVGPTRMDYGAVAAKLSYMADTLSRLLTSPSSPQGFNKLQIKGDDNNERE